MKILAFAASNSSQSINRMFSDLQIQMSIVSRVAAIISIDSENLLVGSGCLEPDVDGENEL